MLLEFQSSAFDRSATSPFNVLQQYLKADNQPHRKRRDGIIARPEF